MANSKVVGKLLIDIEARTSNMETSMAAATAKLDKFNNSARAAIKGLTGLDIGNLGKSFLKFTLLLDGVRSVLNSVANSVKEIWTNADALGRAGIISNQAAATIEDAQVRMANLFKTTKAWAAEAMAFLLDAGKSIRITAQNMAAALFPNDVKPYEEPEITATTDDDRAKAKDALAFRAEIVALEAERGKLIREANAATLVGVEKTKELAEIQARTERASRDAAKSGSTIKSLTLDNEARKIAITRTQMLAAEEKQANELLRQWDLSRAKTDRAAITDAERLEQLYKKQAELRDAGAGIARFEFDKNSKQTFGVMTEADKLALKNLIDTNNQINAILERRRTQMDGIRDAEKEIQETIEERSQVELSTRGQLALVDAKLLALRTQMARLTSGGAIQDPEKYLDLTKSVLEIEQAKNTLLLKQRAIYVELGQTIAQTAADSILQLNKLSDVLKNVAAAIAQVLIQKALIAPVAGMITGGLASIFGAIPVPGAGAAAGAASALPSAASIAPFKAVGGPVMAGRSYIVGEQGQELFTPDTSGNITTNGDMKASRGSTQGEQGLVYAPVYNITSGVTANELRPILRQHEQQVRGSIMQDIARGGRRAAQFGA